MKPTATLTIDADVISQPHSRLDLAHVAGWAITAIFPALFWTGVISFAAPLLGFAVSTGALLLFAGSIGTFLTLVYAAVVMGSDRY